MAKTTNIKLNLTTDESTSFQDWRKSIDGNGSGTGKSNMQLIDEKFGEIDGKLANLPSGGITEETDPTVPAWAKASTKPSYSYDEITGKPTLADVAESGSYDDLTDTPTFANVAFTGSYNDLKDKPVIEDASGAIVQETDPTVPAWAKAENKPTYKYSEITERPTLLSIGETSGTAYDGAKGADLASRVVTLEGFATQAGSDFQDLAEAVSGHETRITTLESSGGDVVEYSHYISMAFTDLENSNARVQMGIYIPSTVIPCPLTLGSTWDEVANYLALYSGLWAIIDTNNIEMMINVIPAWGMSFRKIDGTSDGRAFGNSTKFPLITSSITVITRTKQ